MKFTRFSPSGANKRQQAAKTGHAVVIGGSIAGMLTARVLTDHFAQVTVIERDRLPEAPAFRKGAPQARHPHGLLVRGQQIMEELFPGLGNDLLAQGAIPINMGADMNLCVGTARVQPFESDLVVTACSRPLLEYAIYHRLQASPQIRFLDGQDVAGLHTDDANARVTAVCLRTRGDSDADEQQIAADLVVDASGRTSKMPDWLQALDYTPPRETTIDAQAGYATRIYHRPSGAMPWKALYNIPQAPHQSRGCFIVPLEGDRWHVTLTGFNGDHPPTDEAGFLAFARSLPIPDFYAAIAQAEPLTAPYGYRNAANRLRHYDQLPRYLEGLVAIGDAVYALNPVYGQGMTVAALGALALGRCLDAQRNHAAANDMTGLAQQFQRELARVIAGPWQMATGQDLRWPVAANSQNVGPLTRLMQRYLDRTLITMAQNSEVAAAFAQVQNMLKPPVSLFHPRIIWQVLTDNQQPQEQRSPVPTHLLQGR